MRLGIIGLPQSGKTTIFNALTRGDLPATLSGGRFEVHTAIVDVPDPRLTRLAELFQPKKLTYAKVNYADIAGLEGSPSRETIAGPLLTQLSQMDGFLHIVRCFEDPQVTHPFGQVDPQRDLLALDAELLLNDLIAVERKLERLDNERRKGGNKDKASLEREATLFERLQTALSDDIPLRDLELSPDDLKQLSGHGFLSLKPVLVVLNLGEGQNSPAIDYQHQAVEVLALQGKLEMEIAQLPETDREVFMEEYGISELGLQRVIRHSYNLLGLQSFFTVGPDEVRAWTIPVGVTAYQAAGTIHSDLQRGFIRAEVIRWDELLSLGGLSAARSKGRLRLEGKDYLTHDGEIMHVRFNV